VSGGAAIGQASNRSSGSSIRRIPRERRRIAHPAEPTGAIARDPVVDESAASWTESSKPASGFG